MMTLKMPDYENIDIFISVLAQFPGYVFLKDKSHKFILCNQNYADVLSFESPTEIKGLYDNDLPWANKENELYLKDDTNVMKTKKPAINIIESQTTESNVRPIITSKYPIFSAKGQCMAVLGIFYYPSEIQKDYAALSQLYHNKNSFSQLDKNQSYSVRLETGDLIEMSYYEMITAIYLTLGYSAKMIANTISRSVRTVEHYIEFLKKKLKCSSRYSLVDVLMKSNLINLIHSN